MHLDGGADYFFGNIFMRPDFIVIVSNIFLLILICDNLKNLWTKIFCF
jgi:hypothetical protein